MPKLTITSLGFGEQSCDLPDGNITVGRAPRNMMIIDDPSVSSEHCELMVNGNEVIVRDLGSRNGTFVNDHPVQSQCQVKNGQEIRFGRVEARMDISNSRENDTTSVTAISYKHSIASPTLSSAVAKTMFPITFAPFGGGSMGETMMFTAKIKDEVRPVESAVKTRTQGGPITWMIIGALSVLLVILLAQYFR